MYDRQRENIYLYLVCVSTLPQVRKFIILKLNCDIAHVFFWDLIQKRGKQYVYIRRNKEAIKRFVNIET